MPATLAPALGERKRSGIGIEASWALGAPAERFRHENDLSSLGRTRSVDARQERRMRREPPKERGLPARQSHVAERAMREHLERGALGSQRLAVDSTQLEQGAR